MLDFDQSVAEKRENLKGLLMVHVRGLRNEDYEDACQYAFMKLWEYRETVSKPWGFVLLTGKNWLLDHTRRKWSVEKTFSDEDWHKIIEIHMGKTSLALFNEQSRFEDACADFDVWENWLTGSELEAFRQARAGMTYESES